jgi:hypothetical protein
MTEAQPGRHRTLLTVLAVAIVVWGGIGALDLGNQPYSGFLTDGNNTVIQVTAGSPAATAGMQEGDYIRSIGGIPVEDSRELNRRGRAAIGETRAFGVERNGEAVTLDLQYSGLPGTQLTLAYLAALLGLCFLGFGLWSYLAAPQVATTALAVFGLCFGIAFVTGPYFESAGLRTFVSGVITTFVIMGFAVLLHFLLIYPERRPVLDRSRWIVYGPAAVVALMILWLSFAQPDATSALNMVVRTVIGLFVAGYFGASLITLLGSYRRAAPEARAAQGLQLMVAGAVLGLVPLTVSVAVGVFSPRTVLPGAQFYFLTLALIPITFAMATVQSGRGGAAAT